MSSSFPIVILNDASFFPTVQLQVHNENPARYGKSTDALVNLNTKLNSTFSIFILNEPSWFHSVKTNFGDQNNINNNNYELTCDIIKVF